LTTTDVEAQLRRGAAEWNRWRDKYQLETVDLSGAELQSVDLRGADLKGVNFSGADLRGARLDRAVLTETNFVRASLQGAYFIDADLQKAVFVRADLSGAELTRADLRGVDFREAELAGSTWSGATISRKTRLHRIRFAPSHQAFNDGSDTVNVPRRDRILSWSLIRVAGALPLFEVSYIGLTGAILAITSVGYLNNTELITQFLYPIPLPDRLLWLLLSSFLLLLGTSMYRLACPQRVQEFSETQWVEQHGRPRIQYFAESSKRKWQWSTAFFMFSGGTLGLALLIERVWVAFGYVLFELQR